MAEVSPIARSVPIGGVLAPENPLFPQVSPQCLTAYADQGPGDPALAGPDAKTTGGSGQELKEHRFRLVVGSVGGEHAGRAVRLGHPRQEGVPDFAGDGLEVLAPHPGNAPHIDPLDHDRKAESRAQILDELGIPGRVLAKGVVEMGKDRIPTRSPHQDRERHRVPPARNRDHDFAFGAKPG